MSGRWPLLQLLHRGLGHHPPHYFSALKVWDHGHTSIIIWALERLRFIAAKHSWPCNAQAPLQQPRQESLPAIPPESILGKVRPPCSLEKYASINELT